MLTYSNQQFVDFRDWDSGALFADIEFVNCRFQSCRVSTTLDPALRSTVRNITFSDCSEDSCTIDCAIVEDVFIDGLRSTGDLLQTFGAVFNHVTLRGRIGEVMISNEIIGTVPGTKEQRDQQRALFREANRKYYERVDWALDIREAEFESFSIRGVPSELVRRDPETQVVVTKERAIEGQWRQLPLQRNLFAVSLDLLLKRGDESVVLVAPKRSKDFKPLLEDIALLRGMQIAEEN